jgi:hypothetical protein
MSDERRTIRSSAIYRLSFIIHRLFLLAAVYNASVGTLRAQVPGQPDVRPMVVDAAKVKAAGLRVLEGKHLTLYTDVPSSPAVDELPAVFDAAVPQWAAYFGIPAAKTAAWRMNAFFIVDKEKFTRLGLIPATVPDFANGYSYGYELWMNEQPGEYYRRHLLLHEGTHGFMNTQLGSCGAPWFMEGLAELLGTHRWDGTTKRLTLGIMPRNREEVPNLGRLTIVHDEIAAGRLQTVGDIVNDAVRGYVTNNGYAWSWAFATFLDGHPKYQGRFRRLQQQVRSLTFNNEFRKTFQPDLPQLSREWQVFANELEFGTEVPRVAIDFAAGKPLAPGGAKVTVAADRGWQSSRVKLEAGKKYRLRASGRYTIASSPDADGVVKPWPCEPGGVTIRYYRGRPLGMLLASVEPEVVPIGTRPPMLEPVPIGLDATLTSESGGTLYFRVNDSNGELADNASSLSVEIAEVK